MSDLGYLIFSVVGIAALTGLTAVIFDAFPNLKKTLKKPIDIVQKKTADNDLDKKLDRLQKLGQLLNDGVITKEEFEEQKKKIEL